MTIKYLTIHCAATPEGRNVSADEIARWDISKFGQESYHHIVTLDGHDHVRMPDHKRGAHVAKANSGNVGVCYVGGMDKGMKAPKDTRTEAQKITLHAICQAYRARYPGIVIRGHNEWPGVAKACPSFSVKADIAAGRL